MNDGEKKGFDGEFVEEPSPKLKRFCSICKRIIGEQEPAVSQCYDCINNFHFQPKGNTNPERYEAKNFKNFPNKSAKRHLYTLNAQCVHKHKGCKCTWKPGEDDQHLNFDPVVDSHTCFTHELMKTQMQSLFLEEHEQDNQSLRAENLRLQKTVDWLQSCIQYSDQQVNELKITVEDFKQHRQCKNTCIYNKSKLRFSQPVIIKARSHTLP